MTKTFINQMRQGDLFIRRIDKIPANAVKGTAEKGRFVLAHSETGHDHVVMERPGVTLMNDPVDQFRAYLSVDAEGADLVHLRDWDTHETIHLGEGDFEIRRQREYMPEGFRRAAD